MGKQIVFHMLEDDCKALLEFVQQRDPVVVTARDGASEEISPMQESCKSTRTMCLWNRSLLPALKREFISDAKYGPYYRVYDDLPVLELSVCQMTDWEGTPALIQGRVYAGSQDPRSDYKSWFDAIARWIRKRCARNRFSDGYVSPSVSEWQASGGILLPMFKPPVTAEWLKFFDAQRAARSMT